MRPELWTDIDLWLQEGRYQAVLMSPPCSTFSVVLGALGKLGKGGPLMGRELPELKDGVSGLRDAEKKKVSTANYFSAMCASTARTCNRLNIPFIIEQPKFREGKLSMLKLARMERVVKG